MNTEEKSALFLSVMDNHKGIIYKIAFSYCKEPKDREDLIQEIFIQLWKSFDGYNNQYKYSTWIYRIALNTAISFYRKEIQRNKLASTLEYSYLTLETQDDNIELDKNLETLYHLIHDLKEVDKAMMLLYLDEKSYREIAEIMGYTETNVATKISRIKKSLQNKFLLIKK